MFVVVKAWVKPQAFFIQKAVEIFSYWFANQAVLTKNHGMSFSRSLLIVVFLILSLHARAQDKNTKMITWVIPPNSPLFQVHNNSKTEIDMSKAVGAFTSIHRRLEKLMPQYKHEYILVNVVRAQQMVQSGKALCSLMLIENTERKSWLTFGKDPLAYIAPAGLFISKGNIEKYKAAIKGDAIELKTLMKGNVRLGVVAGRTFSPDVDQILKAQKSNKLFQYFGETASSGLMEMLQKGRIDGVIAYYGEVLAYAPGQKDSYEFFPIQESADLHPAKPSCTKTAWGQKVLSAVEMAATGQKFYRLVQDQYRDSFPQNFFKYYQDQLKRLGLPLVGSPTSFEEKRVLSRFDYQ